MAPSVLDTIGVDIVGVMSPVSVCMLAVVVLVYTLTTTSDPIRTVANVVYLENASDSAATKLEGALLNAAVVVAVLTAATFLLVALYYFNFTRFLKAYLLFSVFSVLAAMGGSIFLALLRRFSVPVDAVTCFALLFNFTIVGVLSIFSSAFPIFLRQAYMVSLGILFAASLTRLPEWSTWVLLAALAVYDVAAVLAPGGPLKLLVELASSRDEELPALIYQARPSAPARASDPGSVELQAVRDPEHIVQEMVPPVTNSRERVLGTGASSPENSTLIDHQNTSEIRDASLASSTLIDHQNASEIRDASPENSTLVDHQNASEIRAEEETSPLVELLGVEAEREPVEMRPNADTEMSETRGIQLGLGDFIFYSVLVGRAAMYDLMTVYACYLAIISGLGCTLVLLSVCRRPLPALPISITLGIVFYFLTRLLMEPFVVGVMTNLMMF